MLDKGFRIGIEREGLRTDSKGHLSYKDHPAVFGDRLSNFHISTDFGEAMLELRTDPCPDSKSCYEELLGITKHTLHVLAENEEYLWPYSMPCRMDEERFRFNSYPDDPEEEEYERVLASIYGIARMCISGIHFNFSISDKLYEIIRKRYSSVPEDKDEAYMRCCRNLMSCEKEMRYFLDASPTNLSGQLIEEDSYRCSKDGYRCKNAEKMDFTSKKDYAKSISLLKRYERFGPVRVKSAESTEKDVGILKSGISRIEFRLCDINPFDICGVSIEDLDLMAAFLFVCLTEKNLSCSPRELLNACDRVNMNLSLGLEKGILHGISALKKGQKRSDRVRNYISRYGMDGVLMLSKKYANSHS